MSDEKDSRVDQIVKAIQQQIDAEEASEFSSKVIEEYQNPKNVGRMTDPDAFGIITGPCGDTMEIYLRVRDDRITKTRFMTDGCGSSIACGSMLTRMVEGKVVKDVKKITDQDLLDSLEGLPDENVHCAKLAVDTLRKALKSLDTNHESDRYKNDLL